MRPPAAHLLSAPDVPANILLAGIDIYSPEVWPILVGAFVFWGLDGYFLWEEKKFRALYNSVRTKDEPEIDFSMDTAEVADQAGSWAEATISKCLARKELSDFRVL